MTHGHLAWSAEVDIWGSKIEDLSDRLALILLLIQERFVHGADSKWHVYMRSLPRFDGDVSGPSFLWSEEEIEELQGSDGYGAALAMYNTVVDEYEFLNATLFKDHETDFPQDTFSFDHFLWGAANVASRAYGDDADGTNLCIAPLVDFLNHKAGALQLTRFGNGIVAYAHKHYEAGQSFFDCWKRVRAKLNTTMEACVGQTSADWEVFQAKLKSKLTQGVSNGIGGLRFSCAFCQGMLGSLNFLATNSGFPY